MKPEACPFCGRGVMAEEPTTHYACGTAKNQPKIYPRAWACYEKEIENLKEQLKRG